MPRIPVRIVVGIALALIVTAALAGVVATSAALTIELSDGGGCDAGAVPDARTTATPEDVTTLAGDVTACLAGTGDPDPARERPPSRRR